MDNDNKLAENNLIVEMKEIVKAFPGVVANAGIDFELRRGEIHTLLGENGAGKTTLMNILYGLYEPDSGEIILNDEVIHLNNARDAIRRGLGMVHQHFMLVERFTVADNIVLGQPSQKFPQLEDKKELYKQLEQISAKYGLKIRPDAEVWTLSVGEQQRVEILKALYRGAEVLILDEPTAVLTPTEVDQLLDILRKLTDEGKSVVFISHKLHEVLAVSDRITVLRDGKVIGTVNAAETTREELACMMVGREVILRITKEPPQIGEPVLIIRGLKALDQRKLLALKGLDLDVCSGEILGIAGVAGNGQSELEEVIAGLRHAIAGSVRICGKDVTNGRPKEVGDCGLAHIPSDRYRMGFLPSFSVAENMVLQRVGQAPFTRNGIIQKQYIEKEAVMLSENFDVRTPSVNNPAGKLSGGNVQKMILARELARDPSVLIAAQPTRGLDVSAIEYVHKVLIQKRDEGMAILLFSTEMYEILSLSDRIAVMYDGEIMGIVDAKNADVNEIGMLMAGERRS